MDNSHSLISYFVHIFDALLDEIQSSRRGEITSCLNIFPITFTVSGIYFIAHCNCKGSYNRNRNLTTFMYPISFDSKLCDRVWSNSLKRIGKIHHKSTLKQLWAKDLEQALSQSFFSCSFCHSRNVSDSLCIFLDISSFFERVASILNAQDAIAW